MGDYFGTSADDIIDPIDPANNFMYGFEGNDRIYGWLGDDTIYGGDQNDTLYGESGDDTFSGGNGNDTLDGGAGADSMFGGDGNDIYVKDNPFDQWGELDDELGGVDTLVSNFTENLSLYYGRGIENLNLSGVTFLENINGTGNAENNVITGNSGKNTIDGKAGADTMAGGDGSDTYIVDNELDKVAENYNDAAGGVDLVKSSVSYVLSHMSRGIENLTLTGSTHINGTGNGNHNVITGNSGNNVLTGLDGNDRLIGGGGKDTLTGGTENDKFVYKSVKDSPAGAGRDVITDFEGNGSAIGDLIDLKAIDANVLQSGDQAFKWKGSTPGGAGTLWYTGGVLNGNIDNDAAAEFQIQLTGTPAVHVTDIIL